MRCVTIALAFAQMSCGTGNGNEGKTESELETSFGVPKIFERMVEFDVNNLLAEVSINGADAITYYGNKQDDVSNWTIQVNVNYDARNTISISWFEIYQGTQLLLSEQRDNFFAELQDPSSTIFAEHTSDGEDRFDVDNDLISNLEERRRGTNPLVLNPIDTENPDCEKSDCVSANAQWIDNTIITTKQGARSTYAMAIQRIVYCLGYADVSSDTTIDQFANGIYGPNSEASVKRYEEAKELIIDGNVGRQTWSELRTELQGPIEFDAEYDAYYIRSTAPECDSVVQFFQAKAPPMGWQMAASSGDRRRIPMTVHPEDLP